MKSSMPIFLSTALPFSGGARSHSHESKNTRGKVNQVRGKAMFLIFWLPLTLPLHTSNCLSHLKANARSNIFHENRKSLPVALLFKCTLDTPPSDSILLNYIKS